MFETTRTKLPGLVVCLSVLCGTPLASGQSTELGAPFGDATLVDEIDCCDPSDEHPFEEGPSGASRIETILGQPTRVMDNTGGARYFAYRIGAGAALEAGRTYVLSVEYPEDQPRTMFILNRGAETVRGVSTGVALGDTVGGYTNNNLESIDYPLSGSSERFRMLFNLHDHFGGIQIPRGGSARPDAPADGFWVIIAQTSESDAPLSAGAAVSSIRLYEIDDPETLALDINAPPEELPRRFVFWREEMSDGVLSTRSGNEPGIDEPIDWFEYKARLARFLGINTFCRDLLEFGANQGWDSSAYGGNDWVFQSDYPQLWAEIIEMVGDYGLFVMPYYEYAGSKGSSGLGFERRAEPLSRPPYDPDREPAKCGGYTHITWSEVANVDVTDPDAYEDFRRMLELTVVEYADQVNFAGVWIRNRVSDMPVSFSDATRARFAEAENGGTAVSREDLESDEALYERYIQWWHQARHDYLAQLRDYLRAEANPDFEVLYTPFSGEPGPSVSGGIVTDDLTRLTAVELEGQDYNALVSDGRYLEATLTPHVNWTDGDCGTQYEWQHAVPPPALERYHDTEGLLPTIPFHRLFSVSNPEVFDAYRTASGVAAIRHFPLNENRMEGNLGYFVSDVDRSGPYSMLAEARALAFGDPRYIGYLAAHSFNRGFPEYVRAFNAAFLALPALPSSLDHDASDHPNVVLRVIPTEDHGTYMAVINTGLQPVDEVRVTMPATGEVVDLVTDEVVTTSSNQVTLSLYPGQVVALNQSDDTTDQPDAGPDEDGGPGPDASVDGGPAPDGGDEDGGPTPDDDDGGCSCTVTTPSSSSIRLVRVLFGL